VIALPRPSVYAVSSRKRLAPGARTVVAEVRALTRWIETAAVAGVDVVQIREPGLEARILCDLVRDAVRLVGGSPTLVLVNDRADVARAGGAAGVHLPSRGLPDAVARQIGPDWLIGRSIHDDVAETGAEADYLIFGTVFPSRSKPGEGASPAGLLGLRHAVDRFEKPVLAIGGIALEHLASCFAQGAAGVAAIGLFLPAGSEPGAVGPAEAVQAIRAAFADARPGSGVNLLE
jgi:thiamine-phosphate pyrophosphorylase